MCNNIAFFLICSLAPVVAIFVIFGLYLVRLSTIEIDVLPMVEPRSFAVSTFSYWNLYFTIRFQNFYFIAGLLGTGRRPRTKKSENGIFNSCVFFFECNRCVFLDFKIQNPFLEWINYKKPKLIAWIYRRMSYCFDSREKSMDFRPTSAQTPGEKIRKNFYWLKITAFEFRPVPRRPGIK